MFMIVVMLMLLGKFKEARMMLFEYRLVSSLSDINRQPQTRWSGLIGNLRQGILLTAS